LQIENLLMKLIFKKILQYYLKYITKLVLFVHNPVIIAVSGSTNKTFTKYEIKKVLEKKGLNVRANPKNFNTEIGLPLAVLNLPSGYNSYRNWIPVMKKSLFCIFQSNFPKYLVLELGVSRKGDMKYLLSIVKPKISVITDITQRYLEGFSGMDDLVGEYKLLVQNTEKSGVIILNVDNIRVKSLAKFSKAKVEFFGQSQDANWIIEEIRRNEKGEAFNVVHDGISRNKSILRFGLHNISASTIGMIIDENREIV
jgi:UDP-N-acetylmuramoyl-tripeptide--D-alanyl-D-alanine ligase